MMSIGMVPGCLRGRSSSEELEEEDEEELELDELDED
jgi:hypothetical protein